MQKLVDKHCHFPEPDTSIVTLIIKQWAADKYAALNLKPQTTAVKKSKARLEKADPRTMLMEIPSIETEIDMMVCLISRLAGTLWKDETVRKLLWDEFFKVIDAESKLHTLPTTTPDVLTKDDLFALADSLVAEGPVVYLSGIEGSSEVAFVINNNENTVTADMFLQTFLKGYRFQNVTVELMNKEDPDFPTVDSDLLGLSIGTFEITDDLMIPAVKKYRVYSLPVIKGLQETPPENPVYDGMYKYDGTLTY